MKIQVWGCRGSIPRPNPEMARYGGNTPCIEVVTEADDDGDGSGGGGDSHRIILDLGSGAVDLGKKILGEMFMKKKKMAVVEQAANNGSGSGEEGKEVQEVVKRPNPKFGGTILVTHTHWDHIQGLPFFVPLYLPNFEWTIYGPHGVAKSLQETLSGQMQHDYFPVRLGDMASQTKYLGLTEDMKKGFWLGEEDAPTSVKVTSKYLNHSVLTLGYKLEEFAQVIPTTQGGEDNDDDVDNNDGDDNNNNRKRASRGVSMAYITDHEPFDHSLAGGGFIASSFKQQEENANNSKNSSMMKQQPMSADQAHTEFFKNVDVLFHDSQYLFSEYSPESAMSKEYWGHSTVEYVVEVAFYANVKQLLLFHHDPQREDDQMDTLVQHAREQAEELERKFGEDMARKYGGKRVMLKVDAAREGGVYELDPFVLMEDDDIGVDAEERKSYAEMLEESTLSTGGENNSTKQSVLLGLYQTEAGPICDVLQNSENAFDVKVLQNSNDILEYAREEKPSVIVLDGNLDDCTGFDVCEMIRTDMGSWGQHVSLLIIASSKPSDSSDDGGMGEEKEQLVADRLNVEDYIQGPFSPSYLLTRIQVSLLRLPLRWRRAPFSSQESERMAALKSTHMLDSLPEERFDRITRLCSTMFNVPISAVSLVDKDRQFFKSLTGLPGVTETPRDEAFCAHAILEPNDIMVVPDALQDARFADNPLVAGGPKIRFYAGCPIQVPSGNDGNGKMPIGTLCVIDSKPRDLGQEELRALRDFGAMVERELISNNFPQNGKKE